MLKILQARLQQYVNCELPNVQAGFRKDRGIRDEIADICWIIEKAREFQKNIFSALLTMPKLLTVWITTNCGKFWKRWEYQTTWPAFWEICVQVRKQQLELDMSSSNRLVPNRERSTSRLYIVTLLTEYIMWNARLDEAPAGIKVARRIINNLRYADDTTVTSKSKEELKSLDESERGEWKSWLKAQHSEN